MIKIVLDKKKLKKELEELEADYNNGNISKKEYFARKRDIGQEMETLAVAERVRRMQGRMGSEKSLDYWSDQEEEKKKLADEAEKQEMLKKYITKPDSVNGSARNNGVHSPAWLGKRAKIGLLAFIVLAFVVGTSMGSLFIDKPSETPQVSMMVNASAFLPTAVNNTNTTTTKTTSNVTTTENTAPTTQTTTPTTTTTTTTTTTDNTPTTPTTPTTGNTTN